MDIAAAQREPKVVTLILILRIKTEVGELVSLWERGGHRRSGKRPRMNVGHYAEGAGLEPIATPMRLEGDPPIGRRVEQAGRAKGIGAQIVLRAEIKRAIGRRLEVEHVVNKSV